MRRTAVAVLVACAVELVPAGCAGDTEAPTTRAAVPDFPDPATPGASTPQQRTVRRAARRYVRARRSGNVGALCHASSVSAQRAPGGVCKLAREVVRVRPLEGARPLVGEATVKGATATVPVQRGLYVARLMLVRQGGHWGVDDTRGLPRIEVTVR